MANCSFSENLKNPRHPPMIPQGTIDKEFDISFVDFLFYMQLRYSYHYYHCYYYSHIQFLPTTSYTPSCLANHEERSHACASLFLSDETWLIRVRRILLLTATITIEKNTKFSRAITMRIYHKSTKIRLFDSEVFRLIYLAISENFIFWTIFKKWSENPY